MRGNKFRNRWRRAWKTSVQARCDRVSFWVDFEYVGFYANCTGFRPIKIVPDFDLLKMYRV